MFMFLLRTSKKIICRRINSCSSIISLCRTLHKHATETAVFIESKSVCVQKNVRKREHYKSLSRNERTKISKSISNVPLWYAKGFTFEYSSGPSLIFSSILKNITNVFLHLLWAGPFMRQGPTDLSGSCYLDSRLCLLTNELFVPNELRSQSKLPNAYPTRTINTYYAFHKNVSENISSNITTFILRNMRRL